MTVAEVARCFQRLCPRLSLATIPRLRGWRSWNEHGKKPAAALGMTSWSGDGACGYVGPKGPTPKAGWAAMSELPTGARNSRSLAALGMTGGGRAPMSEPFEAQDKLKLRPPRRWVKLKPCPRWLERSRSHRRPRGGSA